LKEQGVNVELANWRGVFAPPGITDAQKNELIAAVDKTVKGKAWQDALEKNQWTNLYLAGDEFKKYLDGEIKETEKIITGLGLVKK
jgi:putative tricarboxylic transport membrane protein